MESAGLTPSIIPGDYSFAAGKQAAELLLAKENFPRQFLQPVTMPQLAVLCSEYVKVPEQLAVLGFDNSSVASMIYPGITTIDQPFKQMGRLAIEHDQPECFFS